ncbi:hypothetical protein Tco_0384826 [Tanacetum coccineum]
MEIDIEEDENEPELTYPYEEVDPLNPSPSASESEPDDEIEIENLIEHEDETVPDKTMSSCGRETAHALVEKDKERHRIEYYGIVYFCMTDNVMPSKSAPMNPAAIRRMNKESVESLLLLCNPAAFHGLRICVNYEGGLRKQRLFSEIKNVPRMVEPERLKIDAYIRGLTDNIKGEVTSSKPANLNKAIRMAHKLMEQKSQARNERILEVNHIFEINLMPIELGTFDVIISMDWLVKQDAVIVCGEKVVRIPYGNKMLIAEG